eukprot:4591478-Amphidinium_carterae.1
MALSHMRLNLAQPTDVPSVSSRILFSSRRLKPSAQGHLIGVDLSLDLLTLFSRCYKTHL